MSRIAVLFLSASLAFAGGVAEAGGSFPVSSFALVGGETSVPYGWVDFCQRRPGECSQPALPARDVKLTAASWRMLNRSTGRSTRAIEPVSNLDHWGTILDHWDYPTDGKGDCKIYAALQAQAADRAWLPRQALLMTIVRDLEGEGHAISR